MLLTTQIDIVRLFLRPCSTRETTPSLSFLETVRFSSFAGAASFAEN